MKPVSTIYLALLSLVTFASASAQTEVTVSGDGGPAVLFDGEEITQEELAALSPDQMGDIKILDGAQAKAKYGKYAEHGVVVVTGPGKAAPAVAPTESVRPTAPAPPPAAGKVKAKLPDASYYEIDGRPASAKAVRALDPASIESLQVFKGSEAEIRFGPSAKDGAVSVVTKK